MFGFNTRQENGECNTLYDRLRQMANEQATDTHRLPPMPVEYGTEIVLRSSCAGSFLDTIYITHFGRRIAHIDKNGLKYRSWFHRRNHHSFINHYIPQYLKRLETNIGKIDGRIGDALIPTELVNISRPPLTDIHNATTHHPKYTPRPSLPEGHSASVHQLFSPKKKK